MVDKPLKKQGKQKADKKKISNSYAGILFEQYLEILSRHEKEISQTLEGTDVSATEKGLCQEQLIKISTSHLDEQASYQAYNKDLVERIIRLEELTEVLPSEFISEVKQTLEMANNKQADALFKGLEEQANTEKQVRAEAAYQRGKIAEAELRFHESCDHFERALLLDLKNTRFATSIGFMSQFVGDYQRSIHYLNYALDSNLKLFGEDHESIAALRGGIGLALNFLGESGKARTYLELALDSDLKTFGEEHPLVAKRRNNVGEVLLNLGEHEKAIACIELALASGLKTLHKDHPDLASYSNNLGSAWHARGEHKKAIEYFEPALAIDLKTFGENHPAVAVVSNNLGLADLSLGQLEKAISCLEQSLSIIFNTYGEDHPFLAERNNNLGGAWRTAGDYKKAIGYFQKAATIARMSLGKRHPTTKQYESNLKAVQFL